MFVSVTFALGVGGEREEGEEGDGWGRADAGAGRRLRLIGAADDRRPLRRFSRPSLGSQGRRGAREMLQCRCRVDEEEEG